MDSSAIWLSVKVSIIAVVIVLVLGTCLATWMLRSRRRGRAFVDSVVMLPLVLPPSVVGFLLLLAFGKYGPLGIILDRFGIQVVFSWQSAVIASVVVSLPLMYQSVKTALESVDPKLEQAARILGAGELKVLRTITFPIAWPGFVSGTIMAFARSLGEFGATLDDVVEEVLFVTDMDKAFAAAGPVRKEAYGSEKPAVASTIVVTPRLALPTQLIEIKFIARVR